MNALKRLASFFLPYEYVEVPSSMSTYDIIDRMKEIFAPWDPYRRARRLTGGGGMAAPYEVQIEGSSFKVKRIINYRNSFLPVGRGEVVDDLGKSLVRVTLMPNMLSSLITTAVIVMVVGSVIYRSLFDPAGVSSRTIPDWASAAVLMAFFYMVVMVSFKVETRRLRRDFTAMFSHKDGDN